MGKKFARFYASAQSIIAIMPCVSIIAAVANNRVIGNKNALPWHLPEDLKRFRSLTTGHHIIMGRKTYESLNRLLPNRITVIVSRNPDFAVPGALIAQSLQQAIALCHGDNEIFIIGGAALYREALQSADKLYLTQIDADFEGDVFFPEIDPQQWHESDRSDQLSGDGFQYRYVTYQQDKNAISPPTDAGADIAYNNCK